MQGSLKAIRLDIINHCNAKCPFCAYHGTNGSVTTLLKDRHEPFSRLSLKDVTALARGCRVARVKPQFRFSGRGEATIHPHFAEMLSFLHAEGYGTRLITNGVLLARHAAVLKACNTEVLLSVHGATAVHDAVIGRPGALAQAEVGLYELMRRGVRPEITVILTPENIEGIEEVVGEYAERGLPVRLSHNFDPKVRARTSAEQVRSAMARVRERFPHVRELPNLPDAALERYYGSGTFVLAPNACTRHGVEIEVNSDGAVSVCASAPFGNIRERSFAEILTGAPRGNFLAEIASEMATPRGLSADRCDRCCYQSSLL
jgi:MoaA/NifB/PqqE/SkfB family radical SAM enzyme